MKHSRTRRKPISIPVASMGDIAFLLIIFFMVCSNFMKEAAVDLKPPTAKDLEGVEESQISIALTKDRELFIQGTRLETPDPDAVEAAVSALIEGRKTEEGRTVMFKCDRNLDRELFEPIIEAIARGGARIRAVGEAKNEAE